MTKTIDTLLDNIENLFINGKDLDETNLNIFLSNLKEILIDRFKKKEDQKPGLRMSRIGVPNLRLWYDYYEPIPRDRVADFKFLYGDLIEQLMLLLVKEAGHLVEDEQATVVVDGIEGHIDCRIDGYVVDIKSTSNFAFKKFLHGTLDGNDPFGYIAQLSGYMHAYNTDKGAFLAANKETGQRALYKPQAIDMINVPARIKEVKEVVSKAVKPTAKCYPPTPYGKSGNLTLDKNCSYCPHKFKCWMDANNGKGIRQFKYANETVDFVSVVNEPRVEEITTA